LAFLRGRSFRRIAIGGGLALAIGGIGAWVYTHRHMLPDTWTAIRRHIPINLNGEQAERSAPAAHGTHAAGPSRAIARESSPAAATLARAQGQIEAGKPKAAEKTLTRVLREKLPRQERALAFRLMGAAESRLGHRRPAIAWYRKSLKFTDDAGDRDRVGRRIKQLSSARRKEDVSDAGGTP
jgi:hypothetical protein